MLNKWSLVFFLSILSLGVLAFDQLKPATMEGTYLWNREPETPGNIRAEFKPTSDGQWSVAFYFKFRDKDYIYEGTATGSLTDGNLQGTVLNDEKKRTFVFRGTCKDGQFNGTHAGKDDRGKETEQGSMALKLKS